MPNPACYVCGRATQRFLAKFAVAEQYICRVCENGVQSKQQRDVFPAPPDYEMSREAYGRLPHTRRENLLFYSNEELMERYEESLAQEEAWG